MIINLSLDKRLWTCYYINNKKEERIMLTSLGKQLRVLRIHNGELLKDMALKLSVTPAYLSSIENGKRTPPKTIVSQLEKIYNLDDETTKSLQDAYFETINEIKLNINGVPDTKKELGLVFARKFDGLSKDQVSSLIKILNSEEKTKE